MAELAITQCEPVDVVKQFTGPAAETIPEGARCRFDATNGQIALGNATVAAETAIGGIALHAAVAGQAVTIINQGTVDVGAAIDALDFGGPIYIDDADGKFGSADTDSTVDVIVGRVVPGWDGTAAQKLIYFNGL